MATERILPRQVADDGSVHYTSTTSAPDDSHGVCYLMPERVIPVIFVPGIMGSNLMDKEGNTVWLVNSKVSVASQWFNETAGKRKRVLDPNATRVYRGGKLPTKTPHSAQELHRRGWGEVGAMSYGDFLVWLDHHLNDYHPETNYGRDGLRAELMKLSCCRLGGHLVKV